MGLNIGCECEKIDFRAGSYHGFHWWRQTLAKLFDIDLEKMAGFDGIQEWTKKEPHYELLNHSDCDGYLTSKQCVNLAIDFSVEIDSVKLSKILKQKEEFDYWINRYNEWKSAVIHSIKNDCKIIFC